MTEERIVKLFRQTGLGTVLPPITPVSGGFLHRMYRVNGIQNRAEAIVNNQLIYT